MVVLNNGFPNFNQETTSAFYTTDDLLDGSPFLVFYGPSATTTSTTSASRIQTHVLSPAGLVSFPRLAISPSSPFYAAVHQLPKQEQGDEICRGLAFSICKFFSGLAENVKELWMSQAPQWAEGAHVPDRFSAAHAALLAPRLLKVADVSKLLSCVRHIFSDQRLSWLDCDVVFPPGALQQADPAAEPADASQKYGRYESLVGLFGELTFLPTSRLRRAPSRPGLNSNRKFLRRQKESLRREFHEILATEESYVAKVGELAQAVSDFRTQAGSSPAAAEDADLDQELTSTLDAILQKNTAFMNDLGELLSQTEQLAGEDISRTTDDEVEVVGIPKTKAEDSLGAAQVASCLLHWFPEFDSCYTTYISSHERFTNSLRSRLKGSSKESNISTQSLMSALIEPVQRLPRYSMFVDNIIKQLPIRHPAMGVFLKARDTISEICARDQSPVTMPVLMEELKTHVSNVPAEFPARGRFITAVDVGMVLPRRDGSNPSGLLTCPATLLLFTDNLVVLRRHTTAAGMTAASLRAKLENPSPSGGVVSTGTLPFEYVVAYPLHTLDLLELDDGERIQITRRSKKDGLSRSTSRSSVNSNATIQPDKMLSKADILLFELQGPYKGNCPRLTGEIAKARVEWRYSERERESARWEVRSGNYPDLKLFSALCETGNTNFEAARDQPARIRILIDPELHFSTHSTSLKPELFGVDILALLSVGVESSYRLTTMAVGSDERTNDVLSQEQIMPVLVKRLSNIMKVRSQLHTCNEAMILPTMNWTKDLLKAVPTASEEEISSRPAATQNTIRGSASRPTSPVKILSSLFSASVSRESHRKNRSQLTQSMVLNPSDIPIIAPPKQKSRPSSKEQSQNASPVLSEQPSPALSHSATLEDTLNTYIEVLNARKGNFVGRIVQNRGSANDLDVNDLYNALLQDPSNRKIAAQSSVDVLLVAFEKFIKFAWAEEIGPVISSAAVQQIQMSFEQVSQASDFVKMFRETFFSLPPINQRAFKSIAGLLSDLLDGTGNDSDRGILTAYFAEILIAPTGAGPYRFIGIIDRFMEDLDLFFTQARPLPSASSSVKHSKAGSHGGSVNNSLTSNTSIRKRLGLGLGSLSKGDGYESSGLGSVWRSLSKNKTLDKTPEMTPYNSVDRNTSIRTNASQPHPFSRTMSPGKGSSLDLLRNAPGTSSMRSSNSDTRRMGTSTIGPSALHAKSTTHERPTVLGAFHEGRSQSPSAKSQSRADPSDSLEAPVPRHQRKRRSSVSDIHALKMETSKEKNERWGGDPFAASVSVTNTPLTHSRSQTTMINDGSLPSLHSFQPRSPSRRTPGRGSNIPLPRTNIGDLQSNLFASSTRSGFPESPLRMQSPSRLNVLGSFNRKENQVPSEDNRDLPMVPPLSVIPRLSANMPGRKPVGGLSPTNPSHIPRASISANLSGLDRSNSLAGAPNFSLSRSPSRLSPLSNEGEDENSSVQQTPQKFGYRSQGQLGGLPSSEFADSQVPPGRKLKMQSPSKLRERLRMAEQTLFEAEASFKAEVDQISDEIKTTDVEETTAGFEESSKLSKTLRIKQRRLQGGKVVPVSNGADGSVGMSSHPRLRMLETKLSSLESKIRSMTLPMQQALAALSKDFDSSLQVSEARARNLDKLYQEARDEVESLYFRYNAELKRLNQWYIEANSDPNGPDAGYMVMEEEDARRREEMNEEIIRLRRENAQLKRDVSGLRAQFGS